MGFHAYRDCVFVAAGHGGCSMCFELQLPPKEPTVMDFPLEAKFVWQTLEQLRDLDAEHFQELAPKYLELVIRRAATQAARGVIIADRVFEGDVREAVTAIESALATLKFSLETL